jgi:endonuclease III
MPEIALPELTDRLEVFYGKPDPPDVNDPWDMIVWENIAYLVNDERRRAAMTALCKHIGARPEQILAASPAQLQRVAVGGIVPEQSVQKLRRSAEIALEYFGGDLRPILKYPLAEAKKALKKFPGIGDPGAEKILMYCEVLPALALESNGLRVLLRLGFGEEKPNYSTTYRLVQEASEGELVDDYAWLIKTHQLLRYHGQQQCRRSKPLCSKCPVADVCTWLAATPKLQA